MTNDGRRDPRKPTVLQIRFKNATVAEFLEKHSRDISRGGIFIKMKSPFPPGTLIKFDIRIAEDSMIHGVGRVAWCRQQDESQKAPSGMGVKFIKLDEKSRLILDAVLAEKDPKEEAHTPLFDDALPKPKSKPPRIPKIPKAGSRAPQSDEKTDVPRPSPPKSGVALEDDTKKIPREKKAPPKPPVAPKNFGDEAETVVSDTAMLKDVLKMARRSVEGEAKENEVKKAETGEDTVEQTEIKELTNTENLFTEDISSAIEDALQPDESEAETTFLKRPSSSDSTSSTPISTAIDYQDISSRPTTAPPPTRRPSPLTPAIIGLGALLLAGGVFYFVFGRNSSAGSDTATEAVSQHAAPSETPAEPKVTPMPAPEAVAAETTEPAPSTDTAPMPVGETTTIEVASTPKGATVLVDDEPQEGTTPLVLDKLTVDKPVEITVRHFGYCPQTRTVSPKAEGEKLNINLRLAAFKIDINSEPSGAKITIEDKGFGATPRTMRPSRISPEIEVSLAKDGYETAVQRFQETDWRYENETFSLHVNAVLTPISTTPSPPKYTSSKSSKSKKSAQSAPSPSSPDTTAPSTSQTPPKSKAPATATATETTEPAKSESAPAAAPPKPPADDEDQAKPPKEPAKTETPTEKPNEPAEKTEKPPAESAPPPEAPKPAAPEEKPPEKPAPKPDGQEKKPAPEPAPKPEPKDPSGSIDENPF